MKIIKTPLYKIKREPEIYPVGHNLNVAESYTNNVAKILNNVLEKHKSVNFYVSGSSGAILSSILSTKIDNDCNIIYVHKIDEHHHYHPSPNYCSDRKQCYNIVIDDFISTGDTICRILNFAEQYNVKQFDFLIVLEIHSRSFILNNYHIFDNFISSIDNNQFLDFEFENIIYRL